METPSQNSDLSTGATTPVSAPSHHRSWLIITVVAIFVLLVLSWWWQGGRGPGGSTGTMTEEMRRQIMELLNKPNTEGEVLTDTDRSGIETSLVGGTNQAKPTADERQQILESLGN